MALHAINSLVRCENKALKNCTSKASLKHKDSFGKSENLSKIFFAEILVAVIMIMKATHSSNGLL